MAAIKRMVSDQEEAPQAEVQAQNLVTLVPEGTTASPLDLPVAVFRAGLERRKENRSALMDWIRAALVEGTDFGRIHTTPKTKCRLANSGLAKECKDPNHWSKPSLFKPGAEKICGMLGVTVHYPNLTAYEDAALSGKSLNTIILRCELHDGQGRTVAEGIGARNVQKDYDDINKSLKMAGKSAHIDATLRMAGLSEVFTQDIEDIKLGQEEEKAMPTAPADPEPRQKISADQARHIEATINAYGLDEKRAKWWIGKACNVADLKELSPTQYEKVLKKLAYLALENGTATPTTLKDEAARKREAAERVRANAQYAEGQTYRDEMRQADTLVAESRHLERMAEQMAEAVASTVATAA